uniref:Uncharacterized protein n=1 Tax=Clytia hemisphaerica TaxID=252671 RepID=A0A7M5USK5_9CNID|eukprot:TCONS_00062305-protein
MTSGRRQSTTHQVGELLSLRKSNDQEYHSSRTRNRSNHLKPPVQTNLSTKVSRNQGRSTKETDGHTTKKKKRSGEFSSVYKLPKIENKYLINQMPSLKKTKTLSNLQVQRPLSPLPEPSLPSLSPGATITVETTERRRSSNNQLAPLLLDKSTERRRSSNFAAPPPLDVAQRTRRTSIFDGNLRRASRIIDRFEQELIAKEMEIHSGENIPEKNIYEEIKYCRYIRRRNEHEDSPSCPCNKCEKPLF